MLAAKYHGPVHAYIQRALRIHKPEAVDDLAQGFFLRFLAQNGFEQLDRERGSLRGFLMRSVTNYVRDELRKKETRNAASPFHMHTPLPEGEVNTIGDSPATPEEEFNRKWTRERFDEAKEIFRHYCNDKGKQHYWAVFRNRLQCSYASLKIGHSLRTYLMLNNIGKGNPREIAQPAHNEYGAGHLDIANQHPNIRIEPEAFKDSLHAKGCFTASGSTGVDNATRANSTHSN